MRNHCAFIIIIGILKVAARDLQSQPPVFRLYEVDESNNVIRPFDRIDHQLSEVIVENLEHLRIECYAYYPVQLIYTGNGIPILSSNISLSTIQSGNDRLYKFTASAFISPLNEHHTGKYQCSHTDYISLSPYLYVYVPGPALFTTLQGETIYIPKNDSNLLIPCSVSHPRIRTSLLKSDGKRLRNPVTKSNDAIVYDPREGFRVNLNNIEEPEGMYTCAARYNKLLSGVEYIVASEFPTTRELAPQNYEEFKESPEETCTGESCGIRCDSHAQCPSTMNCYTDRICRDPCTYSIRCGKSSLCRNVEQVPECYCPRGSEGDPTKECFPRI